MAVWITGRQTHQSWILFLISLQAVGKQGKTSNSPNSLPQLVSAASPVSQDSKSAWHHPKKQQTKTKVTQKYIVKFSPYGFKCDHLNSPVFILVRVWIALWLALDSASSISLPMQRAYQVQNPPKFYITNLLSMEMICKGWAVCYCGDLISNFKLDLVYACELPLQQ